MDLNEKHKRQQNLEKILSSFSDLLDQGIRPGELHGIITGLLVRNNGFKKTIDLYEDILNDMKAELNKRGKRSM